MRRTSPTAAPRCPRGEAGAAAVEFALVLPLLLALLIGMVFFGLAYSNHIQLSGAAREGARVMAIQNDPAEARAATRAAAPALFPDGALADAEIAIAPASCTSGVDVTVTASREMTVRWFLGSQAITVTGIGVMRCGG